jgi:glycosyltransferase involved in cell wall biosynthesis
MDQPIISVVVPLYNCEKFIDRLAKSLLPQLSKEVELILIDDGSQDKTPELCDELANQNSHVRVMHQENAGPSVARNMGMSMAMGEYIAFVDGRIYSFCRWG